MPTVSIVLLNYNGLKFNIDCIDSILSQSYQNFEIIFVDNASSDGSLEQVETHYKKIIADGKIVIVANKENYGFAKGNNIGATYSHKDSKYICLLNNDTILPKDRLEELVKGIESDENLGILGGMIYDLGFEKQIKDLLFKSHKKGINNYFFDSVVVDQTQEDINGEIIYTTGVSGCCLLYKKNLLDKPFDDIYFAYMEDTALCLKILLQGYRIGISKKAIVNHLGSGSFGKKPTVFKAFHGQKNYILNFIIFSQGYRRIVILPFFIIGIIVRTIANNPIIRIKGLLKAIIWIINNYKTIYKIKVSIKNKVSEKEFYKNLSPLFLSLPYYTKTNSLHRFITSFLNKVSILYFKLFSVLFPGLGR